MDVDIRKGTRSRKVSCFKNILDYILIYFAIAFSGIPFFEETKIARLFFLILLVILFLLWNKRVDRSFIFVLFAFLIIELVQLFTWGGRLFSVVTSISFIVILPYLILKIVGLRFIEIYLNIIFFYSVISIIFWLSTNYIPGFHDLNYLFAVSLHQYTSHEIIESFILYTYENSKEYGFYRNPGPFHEPGAFGIFLILGLVFNYVISKNNLNRKGIVLIITCLTTFSTAVYLSLLVYFFFYNIFLNGRSRLIYYALLPAIIYLLFNLYNNTDFLGRKIEEQYTDQMTTSLETPTSGRILGARKAVYSLLSYPLFGKGILQSAQSELESPDAAGYGWITWVSQIGLIMGFIYLFFIYRALKSYSNFHAINNRLTIIFFFVLLIILSGQKHTSSIIFFMIFLVPVVFKGFGQQVRYNPKLDQKRITF